MAAVMAVRPAGGGVYTPLVKLNGELLSDDTDTSLGRGGSAAGGSGGGAGTGGRVGKRRKRRMMESDGGTYNVINTNFTDVFYVLPSQFDFLLSHFHKPRRKVFEYEL